MNSSDPQITAAGSGATQRRRRLPRAVEQQINENLKLFYEDQLQQDLPDRLKDLVAQLRKGEAGK